ncbi:hypothetical protein F4561_003459 [Lipingzhangella halophila]|uniref:DUF6745 domain-containing protein n=1 Tax=Lipingzhangella halophila TaxID=1783352 RepID=A0A7W7W4A6_9ACTN|nr:hypothetical protein [Lipingzhangella halophila]MBB4932639.1 hypothetical protein [Lipingzhangella halophila]
MSGPFGPGSPTSESDLLRQAITIRDEWLGRALSTLPADRPAAEAAITELYSLVGQAAPRFQWVDSPAAMLRLPPEERPDAAPAQLRAAHPRNRAADWPTACRLASCMADLRRDLDRLVNAQLAGTPLAPGQRRAARDVAPEEALRQGVPLRQLLEIAVREPLEASVGDAVGGPLRTAFTTLAGGASPLVWSGQHEAPWIARYDTWCRLGLATLPAAAGHQLGLWAELARCCGWWWPGEEVCVLAERPRAVHHEPLPHAPNGQIRLHRDAGPAVEFGDGWAVHVLHGTPVPEWVLSEPTAERIAAERNVEVRRTAIERLGWDSYIEQAGLRLLASAPDPGNPGCELRLYDTPRDVRLPPSRLLLAVNGSVERDGRRRRYGLAVPDGIDDPVAAAGWSYGLSGEVYARLARRT